MISDKRGKGGLTLSQLPAALGNHSGYHDATSRRTAVAQLISERKVIAVESRLPNAKTGRAGAIRTTLFAAEFLPLMANSQTVLNLRN